MEVDEEYFGDHDDDNDGVSYEGDWWLWWRLMMMMLLMMVYDDVMDVDFWWL